MTHQAVKGQAGKYWIENYPSENIQVNSQHFQLGPINRSVVRDNKGLVYVANTDGIVVFDGYNWDLVEGTALKRFYKLARNASGQLFTGGPNELGMIKCRPNGQLYYHTLNHLLPDSGHSLQRILNVEALGDSVFFNDARHVYLFHDGAFTIWFTNQSYIKMFSTGKEIILQEKDQGLSLFNDSKFERLPGSERMNLFKVMGAGTQEHQRVIVTRDHGLYLLEADTVTHLPSLLDTMTTRNVNPMPDGNLALATSGAGLVVVSPDGKIVQVIDQQHGLQEGVAIFPYPDQHGMIWLAMSAGVSAIPYPEAISYLDQSYGLNGAVVSLCEFDNYLYAGTLTGCYRMPLLHRPGDVIHFERLKTIPGETQALLKVNATLLVGTAEGIYSITPSAVLKIASTASTVNCFYRSRQDTLRVFYGTSKGMGSLYWKEDKWKQESWFASSGKAIYSIMEDRQGTLWAAGLGFAARLNDRFSASIFEVVDSSMGFREAMAEIEIGVINSEPAFGTDIGLFRFDQAQGQLVADTRFGERFADGSLDVNNVNQTSTGAVWLTAGHTGRMLPQKNGAYVWDSLPLQSLPNTGIWEITEGKDHIWFGATNGVIAFDKNVAKPYHTPFQVAVRRVMVNEDSSLFHGNWPNDQGTPGASQPDSAQLQLPYEYNHLTFSFAALYYEAPERTMYRHQLVGQDKAWSQWSTKREASYTNLAEGTYAFNVQAQNVYGTISQTATYQFGILPPWHRTWWAYAGYALLIAFLVWQLVHWRVHRSLQQQLKAQALERDKQFAMLEASILAQEKERQRIARDLHDDIQVSLATAKLGLTQINRTLQQHAIDHEQGDATYDLLTGAIAALRNITQDLLPVTLERFGLIDAIQELCNKVRSTTDLTVQFAATGKDQTLPKDCQLALYRMVQELFTNTIKYAKAKAVTLQLEVQDSWVVMVYEDDGIGFDRTKALEPGNVGLGMRNLESRVQLFKGKLEIISEQGKGVKVKIELPIFDQ